MAIRWSRNANRFYNDITGYPVKRSSGFRSSIGRREYQAAQVKKTRAKKYRRKPERVPSKPRVSPSPRFIEKRISTGYEARPLAEEFREELEGFDGEIDEEMTFEDYMVFLGDEEPEALEEEDRYSED